MWVKICVSKRISGDVDVNDARERKRGEKENLFIAVSLLVLLFMLNPPPTHTHIIHVPDAVFSKYTQFHTHTHTRVGHMSIFVLVCCRDKTQLCYTPL